MTSQKRKFAITGNVAGSGMRLFWTGGKLKPWTSMETRAKTWATRQRAARWISRVTNARARAMHDLRVVEVAR